MMGLALLLLCEQLKGAMMYGMGANEPTMSCIPLVTPLVKQARGEKSTYLMNFYRSMVGSSSLVFFF